MNFTTLDPEKIIEELKRIIDRLKAEKNLQKPDEKNLPTPS